eukprot:3589621-Pyramimonas_sp.AAC.1
MEDYAEYNQCQTVREFAGQRGRFRAREGGFAADGVEDYAELVSVYEISPNHSEAEGAVRGGPAGAGGGVRQLPRALRTSHQGGRAEGAACHVAPPLLPPLPQARPPGVREYV